MNNTVDDKETVKNVQMTSGKQRILFNSDEKNTTNISCNNVRNLTGVS